MFNFFKSKSNYQKQNTPQKIEQIKEELPMSGKEFDKYLFRNAIHCSISLQYISVKKLQQYLTISEECSKEIIDLMNAYEILSFPNELGEQRILINNSNYVSDFRYNKKQIIEEIEKKNSTYYHNKYYSSFTEKPYISEQRKYTDWEQRIPMFPSGLVQKENMLRTKEGFLLGEILLLWYLTRNKTTESYIPQYFEYKYGINTDVTIEMFIKDKFIEIESNKEALTHLTILELKEILKVNMKKMSGNKKVLIERIQTEIPEHQYSNITTAKGFKLYLKSKKILITNQNIILKHLLSNNHTQKESEILSKMIRDLENIQTIP